MTDKKFAVKFRRKPKEGYWTMTRGWSLSSNLGFIREILEKTETERLEIIVERRA